MVRGRVDPGSASKGSWSRLRSVSLSHESILYHLWCLWGARV